MYEAKGQIITTQDGKYVIFVLAICQAIVAACVVPSPSGRRTCICDVCLG